MFFLDALEMLNGEVYEFYRLTVYCVALEFLSELMGVRLDIDSLKLDWLSLDIERLRLLD